MSDPTALVPPPEFAHFRWHWLIPDSDFDEPIPCSWSEGMWKTPGLGYIMSPSAAAKRYAYIKPCDPSAITLDEVSVKKIANVIEACFARDSLYILPTELIKAARAVITALRGDTAFQAFEEADRLLLSPQKMQPYGGNWVAAFNGDIIADPDLISLRNRLRKKGISLGFVAIRFIEKDGQAAA